MRGRKPRSRSTFVPVLCAGLTVAALVWGGGEVEADEHGTKPPVASGALWQQEGRYPAVELNKTVGTVPGECASTDVIRVPEGTQVHYCYRVENTGDVTFEYHDLVDDQLGVLLSDVQVTLAPGETYEQLASTTINVSTSNTATWTARDTAGGLAKTRDEATDSDTAQVIVTDELIELSKTVGTVAGECAATDLISVLEGTEVHYCYRVENTGHVTFEYHDLVDDQLGVLLSDVPITLGPGDTSEHLASTTLDVSTINTATWTARDTAGGLAWMDSGGTARTDVEVTDSDTAEVIVRQRRLELSKTVGTVAGECASTDSIEVWIGTTVYYCYHVENTGDVTFEYHDLVDDQLGVLLTGVPLALGPGDTYEHIEETEIGGSVVNTAEWTASSAVGAYTWDDTVAYAFEDISTTGTPVVMDDEDVQGPFPAGFVFEYFALPYRDVYISSNGFLTVLPGQDAGCCSGDPIPTSWDPNGVIAGWWEDLDPGAGGTIHYETKGASPNRYMIVQFTDVPHWSTGFLVTLQYKILESGVIEVHYTAAPSDGGTHTAGIENEHGTIGVEYYHGTAGLPTPLAVRYIPGETASDADSAAVTVLDPDITVDPEALWSFQLVDVVVTLPLDIGNVGLTDLVWTVDEAEAEPGKGAVDRGCSSPNDLPWLEVVPTAGTTAYGHTDTLSVIFDSTVVGIGAYEGVLCVRSNDPQDPLVEVPVIMEILIPVELMNLTIE